MVDSVKGKELHMHKYKKYPWLCHNSMINGLGFFLSFYCCISSTSLFLSVFLPPSSFHSFLCYIPWFLCHIHYPRVSQELGAPYPIPHLLESSTLSCKAACLLFRHHLHINTTRELVGQHFNVEVAVFTDICRPSSSSFI